MRRLVIVLALVLAALPALAGAAVAAEVGQVAALRGDVTVTRGGEPRSVAAGDRLQAGDRVVTGTNAMALLQFRGGLVVTVAPETELVVGDVTGALGQGALSAWLELVEGLLRAVLSATDPAADVEIRSPLAVTSVRSTEWAVAHLDEASAVFCREGRVVVRAGGDTVVLADGDGTDIRAGEAPTPAAQWGEARIADTLARTTFAIP